jgi:CheY-like chemotaxis protein
MSRSIRGLDRAPEKLSAAGDHMKRILIVDDEEQVLFVLCQALMGLGSGYEIVGAQSGREALERVKENSFDLVLTDLRMPGTNGVELTESIRGMDSGLAVIWMTAYGCSGVKAEADRLGVHRCLDKPLEVMVLRQIVREALDDSRK